MFRETIFPLWCHGSVFRLHVRAASHCRSGERRRELAAGGQARAKGFLTCRTGSNRFAEVKADRAATLRLLLPGQSGYGPKRRQSGSHSSSVTEMTHGIFRPGARKTRFGGRGVRAAGETGRHRTGKLGWTETEDASVYADSAERSTGPKSNEMFGTVRICEKTCILSLTPQYISFPER